MSAAVGPLRWLYHELGIASIYHGGRNVWLVILSRTCRMLTYGAVSVMFALFLAALGFSPERIGLFMSLTLLGDVVLGLALVFIADRLGRRRVLVGGACLMILCGLVFAVFENFWALLLAAMLGVITVTGGDFGPFRAIEEAILSQISTSDTRADVLGWYVTCNLLARSVGSGLGGHALASLEARGWTRLEAYHAIFYFYTATGAIQLCLGLLLTDECELPEHELLPADEDEACELGEHGGEDATPSEPGHGETPGRHALCHGVGGRWLSDKVSRISQPTRRRVYRFWLLIGLDALADGVAPVSLTAFYVDERFHPSQTALGAVVSAGYLGGALGSAFAPALTRAVGLVNTMVVTHAPASVAVLLFPLAPGFAAAAALFVFRALLNPLDQAPRAALLAAIAAPQERTAVLGVASLVRTVAAACGPTLTGLLASGGKFWVAFVVAGVARLVYDFGLYALFRTVKL